MTAARQESGIKTNSNALIAAACITKGRTADTPHSAAHGGVGGGPAKAVPGIDLVIGGHSHTALQEAIIVRRTC
jgi:hypothetical protein